MALDLIPEWMNNLDEEGLVFVKNFILASGSLKEIAKSYRVTYPTVRLRLDRLIQKIQLSDHVSSEPFIGLVKRLAVDERIDLETARILINEYKKSKREGV